MTGISPKIPKVALVTGAVHRLSRGIVLTQVQQGFDLAIYFNNSEDEAEEMLAEARGPGRRALLLRAGLVDEAQVQRLIRQATEQLRPGVLIDNVSRFGGARWYDVTPPRGTPTWTLPSAVSLC
jgi:NAD(P)-dependent dehydrogenase (short-subunit alcohol dehydrogenase family)